MGDYEGILVRIVTSLGLYPGGGKVLHIPDLPVNIPVSGAERHLLDLPANINNPPHRQA